MSVGYIKIPLHMIAQQELKPRDFAVYAGILFYLHRRDNVAEVSIPALAKASGLKESAVRLAIKALKAKALIAVEARTGRSHRFSLLDGIHKNVALFNGKVAEIPPSKYEGVDNLALQNSEGGASEYEPLSKESNESSNDSKDSDSDFLEKKRLIESANVAVTPSVEQSLLKRELAWIRELVVYATHAKGVKSPSGFIVKALETGQYHRLEDVQATEPSRKSVYGPKPCSECGQENCWCEISKHCGKTEAESFKQKSLTKIDYTTPEGQWIAAWHQLELQLGRARFDTWLRTAKFVSGDEKKFVISVHNEYAQDMLQHRLYRHVRRVVCDVGGFDNETFKIEFVVEDNDGSKSEVA